MNVVKISNGAPKVFQNPLTKSKHVLEISKGSFKIIDDHSTYDLVPMLCKCDILHFL